ncbi:MAG: hypothetical protein JO047_13345 [Alphaproteobacteria bacterium]|nr:hypothetical protein [Alphaproteobacteria bacterium]
MAAAPMTVAVVQRAEEVVSAAEQGAAWLQVNRDRLRLDAATLNRSFRKLVRRAQRLRRAAERPACVAVFGASQAGKSYFINSLAEHGKPFTAVYGTHQLNFLRSLNPQGEKESTGLVSRFTVRSVPAPAETPVPLQLLSQTEIVKILANAFFEDFRLDELRPPGDEEVAELFRRLSEAASPAPQGGLDMDDIEELQEYFERHFRSHTLFEALTRSGYWGLAADLIPRLPPRLRNEAYAPLWNGTPAFTRLAGDLIVALERLGFPETAYCGIEALTPREQGILNVDTVFALGDGPSAPVQVATRSGRAQLDRSVLAALVAEITVPMATQPWDFFADTDLLDFPGARSREVIKDVDRFLTEPGRLGRIFLRGKVAYLFQRYNAEQEISAMVLCVGPSVQEVQTLPEMINGWVRDTIGAKPEARARQRNALFLVLTKFDLEFVEKTEGEDITSGERWTTRLQASLLDFFGKAYDWPREWLPGKPFNNTFWFRSPKIGFPALFDRTEPAEAGASGGEIWSPRADAYVAPRRAAYLANPLVQAHFADAERAWSEALKPNDGGIVYIAESLRPVCDPALKAEQIGGRLAELAGDVATQLRPHFHSGDLAAELQQARRNARRLQQTLVDCAAAQMFGALLRALMVTDDQMGSAYRRLQSDGAPIGAGTDAAAYLRKLGLPVEQSGSRRALDRFERLAELALDEWLRSMQAVVEDPETATAFRVPREQATMLVGELARAARRLELRETMATELRARASFQHQSANAAQKPILLMEQRLNGFVHMLGYDRLAPAERPLLPDGSRRIFRPRADLVGLPQLGPSEAPYDTEFHLDWITAIGCVFEDNVRDAASGDLDIAANERLGSILGRLEA